VEILESKGTAPLFRNKLLRIMWSPKAEADSVKGWNGDLEPYGAFQKAAEQDRDGIQTE